MRLPSPSASWAQCVRYSHYVTRRLRTAQLPDLTDEVLQSTVVARDLGRSWEDLEFSIQESMADRDAADLTLDSLAREARRKLLARSDKAEKSPPYTLIFPDGLAWYVAAPVGEELDRYRQLRDRLEANLPAEDELRAELIPRLEKAIDAYSSAALSLSAARNAEVRSRDALEQALTNWRAQMDRVYGQLTAQLGRADAEDFFPSARRRAQTADA